jgi:pyrimidine operon attenuation protein/uracil phosphoribosyltransferase
MSDRDAYLDDVRARGLILPPLAPPIACRRCLRPLEPDKRQYGTCYPCGWHHPRLPLSRVLAGTYGAAGTDAWKVLLAAKFGGYPETTVTACQAIVAAVLSMTCELHDEQWTDAAHADDHFAVLIPSRHALVETALEIMDREGWRAPIVRLDALTAADRPPQTDLHEDARREAASGKYSASSSVAGAHILLLDDVYTSGYTIHDAARALGAAGAATVTGIVYSRRIYPDAMALYRKDETG